MNDKHPCEECVRKIFSLDGCVMCDLRGRESLDFIKRAGCKDRKEKGHTQT